ncbi:MAG: hypothetical protein A2Y77_05140 [Planctomycetes bacterium RBG_13_62_9]|nr:MAG: hypothetical protein A2Y77_05140 [Planctomycetes bacterium RBG_13_62_9]
MEDWRKILPRDVPKETAHWCKLVRRYWTAPNTDMERLMETLGVIARAIQKMRTEGALDGQVLAMLAQEWISLVCYLLDRAAHECTRTHPPVS